MSEQKRKILDMLAAGKIDVNQAEKLLAAVGEPSNRSEPSPEPTVKKGKPKYLRIQVDEDKDSGRGEKVNIKVPLGLVRAGVKLGSFMPGATKDKVNHALGEKGLNIDLNNLDPEALDELFESLATMSIDVEDGKESVRIYCE